MINLEKTPEKINYLISGSGVKLPFNGLLYTDETAKIRFQNLCREIPGLILKKIVNGREFILEPRIKKFKKCKRKKN